MKKPSNQEQIGALLCAFCAMSLYLATLAPIIQGFDSAELTMGAYSLGFVHPPGYPLYLTIGHIFTLFPLENVGFRMNLMSAFFSTITVYLLFRLLYRHSNNLWISIIFTTLFATTPLYWSQSIRAEVYTLHVLFMIAALFSWYIGYTQKSERANFITFLLLGLAAGNHPTTFFLWITVFVITFKLEHFNTRRLIFANSLAICLTIICYLYFPLRSKAALQIDYIRPYFQINLGNLSGLLWMITGRPFQCLLLPPETVSYGFELIRLIDFLWTGALGFGLYFAVWGWFELFRKLRLWNLLLSIYFLINIIMFLSYHAIDKEVMFLPIYLLITIWASAGISPFINWMASIQKQLDQSNLQFLLIISLFTVLFVATISDLPNVSLRKDQRVYEYTQQLMKNVKPDTVIVNHWATASVIDYLQIVEGLRPDIQSLNVDFYFLGIQKNCQPPSEQELLENGWITHLLELSDQNRICYIEPLHNLPEGYRWLKNGICWQLQKSSKLK